jgi:glycerol-3-phosphate dehydrogenase
MDRIGHLNGSGFDLIIFGGGSLGAGIARDGAMRGLSVLLVEQKDFGWGTSSRTSKIIHGGIRYLEYGDLGLVFEALRERFILEKIASHLVHPLPFLIPVYKDGPRPLWKIRAGLFIYDALSLFKNRERYRVIGREETLKRVPFLNPEKLLGAGVYYDSQMNDARVVLENILDAKSHGAAVFNYVKLEQFKIEGGALKGVLLKDQLTGQTIEVKGRFFVNATGPWVEQVAKLTGEKNPVKVRMTQGTHIIVPRISGDQAVVVSPRDEKRIFFILPWGQHSLIGTTDIDYQGDPGDVRPLKEEIQYLMGETNTFFPGVHLKEKEILSIFSGVRPLLDSPGVPPSSVSRKVKIVESPMRMISIAGGKFTTSRSTAEKVIDRVGKWLRRADLKACATAETPLYGGDFPKGLGEYLRKNGEKWGGHYGLEVSTVSYLINHYGTKASKVLDLVEKNKELGKKIDPDFPNIKAEIIYAIENEMALTLSDFMRRRTLLALEGVVSKERLQEICRLMAGKLGWSQQQIEKEIEAYLKENAVKLE